MKLLVVLSSDETRNSVRRTLRLNFHGVEVTEAPDSEAGLTLFKGAGYDFVIADFSTTTRRSRLNFVREVRSLPRGSIIPIYMIVDQGMIPKALRELIQAGVSDFTLLPIDREKLKIEIQALMKRVA